MSDPIVDYLKKHNIPVTRESYINLAYLGDYDPSKLLPPEYEADLPKDLQFNQKEKHNE